MNVTADIFSQLRFRTSLMGDAGGTVRNHPGGGIYNLNETLQNRSPSLECKEAYLQIDFPAWDARLGIQRFAWGKLDSSQPNDVLNVKDYKNPILDDEADRKIGAPALSVTGYIPYSWYLVSDVRLMTVWIPIFVPFRFPDQDERWYPPLSRVPAQTRFDGLLVQNEGRFENGTIPARTMQNSEVGVRLAAVAGGSDFALYYFDGFGPAPSLDVHARGFLTPDLTSPLGLRAHSEVSVFPVFARMRSVGIDFATSVLRTAVRAEASYVMGRLYPRNIRDIINNPQVGLLNPTLSVPTAELEVPVFLPPASVRRDGFEWGVGADYSFGRTFALMQVNQTVVLHNDVPLLISDMETRFSMSIRRRLFDDRLEAEIAGVYGLQGVYGVAHPRLTYAFSDSIELRFGYVLIAGHENSIVGQFRRNDEAYARIRVFL